MSELKVAEQFSMTPRDAAPLAKQELPRVGKVSCSITFPLRHGVIVRLPILFAAFVTTGPTCSCPSRGSAKAVLMKRTAAAQVFVWFGIPVDWFRPAHGGSSVSTRSIRWTSPFPHWSSALSVGHSTLLLLWTLSSWDARHELFSQIGTGVTVLHHDSSYGWRDAHQRESTWV